VAISGAMAGSMRFVFPLAVRRRQSDGRSYRVPAAPLSATLRNPRFLIFFAGWVGLNALFGLGTLPIIGEGQEIAWQAHIGVRRRSSSFQRLRSGHAAQ
jgi:membrane associated rhomboid family serine protease